MRAASLRTVAAVAVLGLLATSCGDDDGGSGADTTTTGGASVPTTVAPGDDTTTTAAGTAERTASFRGVSEDAISVGVVYADLEAVTAVVDIDLDHGSYRDAYQAVIDDVNAAGGVLGRRLEPVFRPVNPLLPEEADAACVELTEDREVFVVLGDMLDDQPLCYTQLNDTAHVGSTLDQARVDASVAPWYSAFRQAEESVTAILEGFVERGVLDGVRVAVVGVLADQQLVEDVAVPTLTAAGIEPVAVDILGAAPVDQVESRSELELLIERHQLDDVELVVTIGQASVSYPRGLEEGPADFRPRIAATALGAMRAYIRDGTARDLSVLEGAVAGNTAEQLLWWDDPAIQRCVDLVETFNGVTILDPATRAAGEPENIVSVAQACRNVSLFVALAEAAGTDLTNDTLAGAGAALGSFHVPGQGEADYATGGADGDVPLYYFEWDPAVDDLRADGTRL